MSSTYDDVSTGRAADAGRSAERRSVAWGPILFEISARSPVVWRWIDAHLFGGHGMRTDTVERIHVVADASLVASLRAAETVDAEVEGYLGEWWRRGSRDGTTTWTGVHPYVFQRHEDGSWTVVAATDESARVGTVRLARELVRMRLRELKAYTVHGALVGRGSGGVLIAGPSGSGKTTLALSMAKRGGLLVSGDQCALLARPAPVGVGFPLALRLGQGTLAGLGHPDVLDPPPLRPHDAVVGGRIVEDAKAFRSLVKVELTLEEITALLGVSVAAAAPVTAVVVLRQADPADAPEIRRGDLRTVTPALEEELREPDPAFASYWLDTGDRPGLADTHPPAQEFFAMIADADFFVVSWHPAAHDAATLADRIAVEARL